MTDENILRAMRQQAWQRAKGELNAVLVTFFGTGSARDGQFEALSDAIDKFVAEVDGEGLAE